MQLETIHQLQLYLCTKIQSLRDQSQSVLLLIILLSIWRTKMESLCLELEQKLLQLSKIVVSIGSHKVSLNLFLQIQMVNEAFLWMFTISMMEV